MSEINPKYVDGEPVCNPDECGQYGYNSDVGSYCKMNEWCFENCPCIPALRRDRDQAGQEKESLEAELDAARGEIEHKRESISMLVLDAKRLEAEKERLKKRVEELEKNRKSTITKEDADRLVEASLESADSLRATLQKVFGN